jgi:NhaA family Na+:H+ antiporter
VNSSTKPSGPSADTRLDRGPIPLRPLADFLAKETASAVLLLIAAVAALVWANSPWDGSYRSLWASNLGVTVAGHALSMDLRHWVSDGLMAFFFLVVGLEIKRELVDGELRDPRRAALPAIAAVGGMLVPAALYAIINAGSSSSHGWGVPMATDIAMAIAVVAALGSRVTSAMKVFLLALAIVDDIGAIIVIAVFYSTDTNLAYLGFALVIVAIVMGMRRLGVQSMGAYAVAGVALWLALHEAGIHATIAGVVMGLLCPARPYFSREYFDADETGEELTDLSSTEAAQRTVTLARGSVSMIDWLEHRLHPWTSFVILPLFALANAGVQLSPSTFVDALTSRVALGVIAGLVVGKTVGISLAVWIAVRLRVGLLPAGASFGHIVGLACVAGVGFTVAILLSSLAFSDPLLRDQAVIGVLIGSLLAAVGGVLLLIRTPPAAADESSAPVS